MIGTILEVIHRCCRSMVVEERKRDATVHLNCGATNPIMDPIHVAIALDTAGTASKGGQ